MTRYRDAPRPTGNPGPVHASPQVKRITQHAGRCPTTGKVAYSTRRKALKVRESIRSRPDQPEHKKCAVYRCCFCQQHHLTSQDRREAA